jgi:hypothetical protein
LTNADYKALGASTIVSAVAIDAAGNKSDAVTQTISIDTLAPVMGLVRLSKATDTGTEADGRTSNKTPSIEFAAENAAAIWLAVDDVPYALQTTVTGKGLEKENVQTLAIGSELSEGVHTIKLKAVDTAGNESIRTTSIVIDSTAPSITNSASNVAENAGDNKVVYKPTTTDASVVSYALKAVDDVSSFTIDTKTGEVTLKNSADFEAKPSYTFTVVATDAAGNSSEKAVILNVTDVNEAPTAVTLNGSTATLAENTNTANPIKVANITVADDALGKNSVTLTGADAANFEVGDDRGLYLKAGVQLDFETKAQYDVTVNVADNTLTGSTPVTANYSLSVSDVNEAPTAVTLNNKLATVAENTILSARMKVADIAITDDALGEETITLIGSDAERFEVVDGALYLKANTALDFEVKPTYEVTVAVADQSLAGSTVVHATSNYSLAVTNVNEAPKASENYKPNITIVNGQALSGATFEPDFIDPENNTLTFTISGTTPPGLSFENGVVTGTPTTDGSYTFTVTASDGSLTHAQEYTVSVVSAPVVQSMSIADAEGNTGTGKQGDFLIITLNLSEAVTLSGSAAPTIILGGAKDPITATFTGLSSDGKALMFSAIAPAGNTNTLTLQTLSLNGATIKGNTTGVDLLVTTGATASYVLDNTPPADAVISVGGADSVLNVTEATSATSIMIEPEASAMVASVRVNDVSLTASNNAYTFDVTQLSQGQHSITVVTQDAAGNTKTTTKAFSVDTLAPQISSGNTANSIAENTAVNQIIYTATSADTTAQFSLKAGSDSGLSIDTNTGAVTLLANPNYEVKPSYSFTVVATDAAGNASEQLVSLAIINANDAPTGSLTITGSSVVGQTLTATNTLADEDGMGTVAYQWLAGGTPIVNATGSTYALTEADLDKVISVSASYSDGLSNLTSVTSSTVTVSNLPPLFGGLMRSTTGGYEFYDFGGSASKFVADTSGVAWQQGQSEEVIGLTQYYSSATGQTYYDLVVKSGTVYSSYSFTQSATNSYQYALVSATPTSLTAAQTALLEITWQANLLGNGVPQHDSVALLTSPDNYVVYHFSNGVYGVTTQTSMGSNWWTVLQNADGNLWQPSTSMTPKAIAYNPINSTVNFYYTEGGVAKFIPFSYNNGLATAGTVNTMGTKAIEAVESYVGVDINADSKVDTVTVANKWAVQSTNATYLVKATDSASNSLFGLVVDNPYDNLSITNGAQLTSFMKLIKTQDGSSAWTPNPSGSNDLSVKAASYNTVTKQYDVLLQSTSTKAFSMWSFGMDGNATTTAAQEVSNAKLYSFEQGVYQDLNGDGVIGTTEQVYITSGTLSATLNNVPSFTASEGWKIDGATLVFTSSTAGTVTTTDQTGATQTIPFTLNNGAIEFALGSTTASYKLLAGNANMMVIGTTNTNVAAAMNQDQNGPSVVMTVYKDTLTTAQALPSTGVTLHTTKAANLGDNYNPVSISIDPTNHSVTFTDIWGVTTTTDFTVNNNVMTVNLPSTYSTGSMSTSGSINLMKVSVLNEASGYYLLKTEKTHGYQQGSTTDTGITDIKAWFMSSAGMNNTYTSYDSSASQPISQQIDWNGNTASFTVGTQTYTVTYDALANSIKFQNSPDYYEEYTLLSNGSVTHTYTDLYTETWSTSAVYSYQFVAEKDDYFDSASTDDTFDLSANGGSDTVVFADSASGNGLDTINGFTFGDTAQSPYDLGQGDMLNLSSFLAGVGVADADTTVSGMQAFAGNSTAADNIEGQVALVTGVIDSIGSTNGLADDIAALFGSGKTFEGLAEGYKAAVLAQGADSASATLWYATGNANGSVTAQQVATMTNIGNLDAITQENFYSYL